MYHRRKKAEPVKLCLIRFAFAVWRLVQPRQRMQQGFFGQRTGGSLRGLLFRRHFHRGVAGCRAAAAQPRRSRNRSGISSNGPRSSASIARWHDRHLPQTGLQPQSGGRRATYQAVQLHESLLHESQQPWPKNLAAMVRNGAQPPPCSRRHKYCSRRCSCRFRQCRSRCLQQSAAWRGSAPLGILKIAVPQVRNAGRRAIAAPGHRHSRRRNPTSARRCRFVGRGRQGFGLRQSLRIHWLAIAAPPALAAEQAALEKLHRLRPAARPIGRLGQAGRRRAGAKQAAKWVHLMGNLLRCFRAKPLDAMIPTAGGRMVKPPPPHSETDPRKHARELSSGQIGMLIFGNISLARLPIAAVMAGPTPPTAAARSLVAARTANAPRSTHRPDRASFCRHSEYAGAAGRHSCNAYAG